VHCGIKKTMANLYSYVYWPRMQKDVAWSTIACILCCTNKPSNKNKGLYHPLPLPTKTWDKISMDFVGGFPTNGKGHDYLFVVVDTLRKMCILMPSKKTIKIQETRSMFFEQVWVHFGIPRSIISYRDTIFFSSFWTTLWENMDTKLKRYTTFHPQIDGKTEVVNETLVQLLRGYNQNHFKSEDETMIRIQHF